MLHLGTIHLKGWKQVIGGLLVLVILLGAYNAAVQNGLKERLPAILMQRLKSDLEQEIARRTLPIDQGVTPTAAQGERYLAERKSIEQLRIVSVEKRGLGRSIVARVRFALGEGVEQTRYYRVKFNWFSQWYVWSSVTESSWHTAWL